MADAPALAPAGESTPAPVSTPTPVTVVETKEPSLEESMAAVYDKMNPDREPDGKFAAKDKPAETVETQEAAPVETETPQEPAQEPTEPAKPAIDAPVSWNAEMKAKWGSLAPEVQEFISKREGEAHKRISELGEAVKQIEPFREHLEPLRRSASQIGISASEALRSLLAANDYLDRDPAGAIQWLAKRYGVNLGTQATSESTQPENEQIRSLTDHVRRLEGRLAETQNHLSTREQRETEAQKSSLSKLVDDFSKDKDYWNDIEGDVLDQIHAIRAREPDLEPKQVLEKAHDRALKLNEAVSAKLNEAKRKVEEATKATEAKKKADEAKRVASMNVKSSKGASPGPKKNWEDTMRETADRLMG